MHIPEDTPANAPLVIVMHGYSSRASSIAGYSGFKELADREKFIVAFPQGTTDAEGYPFFNVGYAFHDDVSVNDLGFIRFVVETLQDDYAASRATRLCHGDVKRRRYELLPGLRSLGYFCGICASRRNDDAAYFRVV